METIIRYNTVCGRPYRSTQALRNSKKCAIICGAFDSINSGSVADAKLSLGLLILLDNDWALGCMPRRQPAIYFLIACHDFLVFLGDDSTVSYVVYYHPVDRLGVTGDSIVAWLN